MPQINLNNNELSGLVRMLDKRIEKSERASVNRIKRGVLTAKAQELGLDPEGFDPSKTMTRWRVLRDKLADAMDVKENDDR